MKIISFLAVFFILSTASAQDKLITKNGKITFEASVPAFEEVKASNEGASCVLNAKTGEIASLVLLKGFRFKIALMEEHFNENYVESDKYPKATFKGKIENFDLSALGKTPKEYTIKGKLELHGKTNEITIAAKIKKDGGIVDLKSSFSINSADFGIEIPSVVSKKVSKKVNVTLDFQLK
ncbi:MAG TPA: YceI family protein [Flavobacterium sp.]|nr:YceI family protein [Flavobacterium sp.]